MRRELVVGTVAAVGMALVLVVIDANDFAHEPPTDNADVVATAAAFLAAVVWIALILLPRKTTAVQIGRAIAAGFVIAAVVVGLASVVYDPFANEAMS